MLNLKLRRFWLRKGRGLRGIIILLVSLFSINFVLCGIPLDWLGDFMLSRSEYDYEEALEFDIGEFDNRESVADIGSKKMLHDHLLKSYNLKDRPAIETVEKPITHKFKPIIQRVHSLPSLLNFSKVEVTNYHYGKGVLKPKQLRSHCAKRRPKSQLYNRKMNVYDRVKIIHCSVPRIASYTFNKLWNKAHEPNKTAIENDIFPRPVHLFRFQQQERDQKFYTHKKILFGREPLSRLWSAYNSKLVNPNPWFFKSYGISIATKRPKYKNETVCGNDITFEEFLRFVINHVTTSLRPNGIWWPISLICDPCNVQYDVIGKIENQEDLDNVLHNVGLTGPKMFAPKVNSSIEKSLYLEEPIRKRLVPEDCESLDLFIKNRWRYFINQGIVEGNTLKPKRTQKMNWRNVDEILLSMALGKLPKDESKAIAIVRRRRTEKLNKEINQIGKPLIDTISSLYELDYKLFGYSVRL
ncbi:DgyrCDS9476 [Dimorphilus gyrociliatus]|uniref:Carbohydrate sulfotransferase n=1 Tax=Dimorphilus gyrociliatus TaxID=2664684 RepID=A0A7I8VX33_9ANNE|nr:DgyrCDS9476 [Dimorphilus gyrociliatus]